MRPIRTTLCCLFWLVVIVSSRKPSLQRVCQHTDANVRLDYDQDVAVLNVTVSGVEMFSSYELHLTADWSQTDETTACREAHLLPHTTLNITSEDV